MKLMEVECIYTPARPSGQLPRPNRRMPQATVINTGSSSGTRLAARILDPHSLSKVRRKLFADDSEPSSGLMGPFGQTMTPVTSTNETEICQRLLEECQNKWNFDLVNCVPLKGRYEWEKMEPENVPKFYSKSYTNPKRRATDIRESYFPNMVANGSYSRKRFKEDSQTNESAYSCTPDMDVTVLAKLNDGNNDNSNGNNNIAINNTEGCNPNNIYNVPTVSISTSTTVGLENTNDKQQDITGVLNDNLTHSCFYSCNRSSNSSSSSSSSISNNNNNNNMGSSSISSTTSRDGVLQRGMSPLMCFTTPVKSVKNVNTGNLHGSHEQDCNNDDKINNNNDKNNVFSEKSDTCDTLTDILKEQQLDNEQRSNLTAIDNKTTISLPSLSPSSSSSSSSPSYSSSAPSSPSSLSPPSSSPLSPYSSTKLPVSSSTITTKPYSMETLNETKLLPKQTKIVDYMPLRKPSSCHTGNREKKFWKE